ncbi:MAG: flagellar hook protein FlgE [Actinomycetota bacterium]|jgi:flagellar hook protein FlgE|nr:flagellar hook protein FlgE [Actinomycetota bacterium]
MATRSVLAAVSGIEADQTYLDEIGNNIANANTVGYKQGTVVFGDLLAEQLSGATAPSAVSGGINPVAVGSGVRVVAVATNLAEGSLETTGNETDVAITGAGYLVVDSNGKQLYTRDGALTVSANGDLTTLSGAIVQGWEANATGTIATNGPLTAIKIPKGAATASSATSTLTVFGNVPAWDGQGTQLPTYTTTVNGYDALGSPVPVTLTLTGVKGTADEWTVQGTVVAPTGKEEKLFTTAALPTITFTSASGQVKTVTGASKAATGELQLSVKTMPAGYTFPTGDTWKIVFPPSGSSSALTQFAGGETLTMSQNGTAAGTLETYSISSDGVITGSFSNGKTIPIAKIALAAFANPSGLVDVGDGLLSTSPNSGTPQIGVAGSGLRGTLLGGQLEQSNVDLANELTDLVTAQETYVANTKVISTSQATLQALVQV